jgi:hypothetical protein
VAIRGFEVARGDAVVCRAEEDVAVVERTLGFAGNAGGAVADEIEGDAAGKRRAGDAGQSVVVGVVGEAEVDREDADGCGMEPEGRAE